MDDNQLFSARSNAQEDQLNKLENQNLTLKNNQNEKGLTEKIIEQELKARLEAKEIQQRFHTMPGYQNDENKSPLTTENAKTNNTVQQCLICFENEPNAVNMNCGHGGICYDCAVEIMQKTGECYLCRQNELEVIQSARLVTWNRTDEQ